MSSERPDKLLLIGYGSIAFLLLTFCIWSTVVPLAESIVAQGTVSVTAQRRTIAHLEGGKVSLLNVSEGDHVKNGQPLLELDDEALVAELRLLLYQRFASQVKLARLTAEQQGVSTVSFDVDLIETAKAVPHLLGLLNSEEGGFKARSRMIETQAALFDERGQKGNEKLARLRQQLRSLDRQRSIVEQQSADAHLLLDKGFGTKSRAAELRLEAEQLLSRRLDVETEIDDLLGIVEDARLNKERLLAERAQEVEQELSETKRNLAELSVQIQATENRLGDLMITSPVEGIVVDLNVRSINDVIEPAAPILDIVPTDSSYLVEAQVSPHEIEGVTEGMDVEVRFPAIYSESAPTVPGKIALVSADIVSNPGQEHRFYRILVSLEPAQELELVPGMPTEVIVKKRERTLLQYLFTPLSDHLVQSAI